MAAVTCTCDGNPDKYYSLDAWGCDDKTESPGHYAVGPKDKVCYNICQVHDKQQDSLLKEDTDFSSCAQQVKLDLPPALLKLMVKVQDIAFKINYTDPFVRSLIPAAKQAQYDIDMLANVGKEHVAAVGKAKLFCSLGVNPVLANVVNMIAMVLYATIFLGMRVIEGGPIVIAPEVLEPLQAKSKEVYDATFDFACSMGALNVYFNNIWNSFNTTDEIMSDEAFKRALGQVIHFVIKYCNDNSVPFLALKYTDGDEIGGEGHGSFNRKYAIFYLVRFLESTKQQINEVFAIDITADGVMAPGVLAKLDEIKHDEFEYENKPEPQQVSPSVSPKVSPKVSPSKVPSSSPSKPLVSGSPKLPSPAKPLVSGVSSSPKLPSPAKPLVSVSPKPSPPKPQPSPPKVQSSPPKVIDVPVKPKLSPSNGDGDMGDKDQQKGGRVGHKQLYELNKRMYLAL